MAVTPQSLSVIRLQMFFDDTPLSCGTGFFWKFKGRTFLVTNWHNISGRDRLTGKPLNTKTSALPNRIEAVTYCQSPDNKDSFSKGVLKIGWPLDKATPWLVHRDFGQTVDLAMWPLPLKTGGSAWSINEERSRKPEVPVASEVFLLGFPLGIEIADLPIWKRGTVASEPEVDVDHLPKLYVDTASSEGMSGAPVIFKASTWKEVDKLITSTQDIVYFLGVYSGRVLKDGKLGAQLGEVWKAHLLEEIAENGLKFNPD